MKLLTRVRQALRARRYSPRTEEAYVSWVRRFVRFHGTRHPAMLAEAEVVAFLSDLAVRRQVSAATQNQALAALLFLYREVLGNKVAWLDGLVHAKRPLRLPVVLSHAEVKAVLQQMEGMPGLVAWLLHGSGMRLLECLRLRVKDLDLGRNFASSAAGAPVATRPCSMRAHGPDQLSGFRTSDGDGRRPG